MFGGVGRVVVQVDGAGRVVEVQGGDDEVGDGDEVGGFGEEGEEGDEVVAVVVGLVVCFPSQTCLIEGCIASFEPGLESEYSQDTSLDSSFSSKEETWSPKLRTEDYAWLMWWMVGGRHC